VLHFNPYRSLFGTVRPDYYAAITDAFIVYPWEIRRGKAILGAQRLIKGSRRGLFGEAAWPITNLVSVFSSNSTAVAFDHRGPGQSFFGARAGSRAVALLV
jgi:hypothetical protein